METFNTIYGKITLYSNETYIINNFRNGGYWDINTMMLLQSFIDPNKNILEIGGHCGTSTVVYASFLNSKNKVYVYEPQKNMYNLLLKNIRQNNLEDKIKPFNYAIFCKKMNINMNGIDLDGGGGIVSKRYNKEKNLLCNFGGISLGKDGEIVNAITIDEDMQHTNIGFIHCDAQGAENHIFSKATKLIASNRPVIFYENNCKYSGYYLYNKVCDSYPEFVENSKFDLEKYCMNELNYSQVIHNFNGGDDDLLIP